MAGSGTSAAWNGWLPGSSENEADHRYHPLLVTQHRRRELEGAGADPGAGRPRQTPANQLERRIK
jgi:hypothetical protein